MPQDNTLEHNLRAVPGPNEGGAADLDQCSKCYGTGMEIVPGQGARKCSCRALKTPHSQFSSVRLPRRYDGFHFANYKPQTPSQVTAFQYAQSLAKEYPAVDRGLLLMGNVGVGKTHLAVSMLKGLTERGVIERPDEAAMRAAFGG